ncbi:MAG: DUF429 domain-containing protein [Gemmatimonadota bacterium]
MAETFGFFGGIDFSGAREPLSTLWSALGHEGDGRLTIVSLRPHAFRADLAGYVVDGWRDGHAGREARILWGADFPFGLPFDVGRDIGAGVTWPELAAWVADRPPNEIREAAGKTAKSLRATDSGGPLAPLDMRLFKQTVEGIRWIHQLMEDGEVSVRPQAPLPDAPVTLIEVYPTGAGQELGLPRRRSPSRPGEARARAAALRTFLDFADADAEALAVTLEDAWDATVACLAAYLARDDLDQPFRITAAPRHEQLRCEGWSYRPPAALT